MYYEVILLKYYILLNSVSSALKGKDILDKNNIKSSVERTPKNNVARSGGYSLMVEDEIERAKEILEDNKVIVLGVVTR